jgi:hypothetical protein
MLDRGKLIREKSIREIRKQTGPIYRNAMKKVRKQIGDYTARFAEADAEKRKQLEREEITKDEYRSWKMATVFSGGWRAQSKKAAQTMTDANQKALDVVNNQQVKAFAESANRQMYEASRKTGISVGFGVYNQQAVDILTNQQPNLLPGSGNPNPLKPRKRIKPGKDNRYNQQIIANTVAHSIMEGDSIPDLADALADALGNRNGDSMMLWAQTAMTSAQNAGTLEAMHQAADMGIKCKKRWLATLDSRTRESHGEVDGETVDLDDEFSNGLRYPGDPAGDPSEVYNCRCTMIYVYEDYPDEPHGRRDVENDQVIRDVTYKEWLRMNGGI